MMFVMMMVMVMEEALSILQQVPNNEDVQGQDRENRCRELVHQLVKFNRYEEHRFPNRKPSRPSHAKHQTYSFDQRKKAVYDRAASNPNHAGFRDLSNFGGQIAEELLLRVNMQELQEHAELIRQIVVRKAIHPQGQEHQQQPFAELYADDDVK